MSIDVPSAIVGAGWLLALEIVIATVVVCVISAWPRDDEQEG